MPCSHSLSQPWLCSRGDLPYRLFVERSYSRLRFPRGPLRALRGGSPPSFFFRPIVPMMQSTLSNNSAQVSLTAAPRRSVAPFLCVGTSSQSCKRLPHRLCVAVKFGVYVCECGKVIQPKSICLFTALPPVPRCRDCNRFFIASMSVSDGSKWNVLHALPSVCITICPLSPLVLTLRVFIR